MTTIKSYTDIEQSKKLAEILPIESADMCCFQNPNGGINYYGFSFLQGNKASNPIPCWSLAALLGVLPKGINISTPKPINELGYCCWNQYDEIYADNPIDACYEMIIKLHEQNLL